MIVPRRRHDGQRRRLVVTASTVVVMLGSYTGLRSTPVPTFGSGAAVIRSLDPLFVERYSAPPLPDPEDRPAERTAEEEATALDAEVGSAIEELGRRFADPEASAHRAGGAPAVEPGIATGRGDGRFRAVFGDDGGSLPDLTPRAGAAGNRPRAAGTLGRGGGGIAVAAVRPPQDGARGADAAPASVAVEAGDDARAQRASTATEVVIQEYQPETFRETDVALLTQWMERHPADLPVGVKVHLRHQAAFLTSAMPLVSGDREIELFLMFNPGLRELHIVIVEDDRSVYLIDRGFQEQSRSLREGTVRRLDGQIVAVDSHAGAASSDRAGEFYNVFLSWWEVAKADAR